MSFIYSQALAAGFSAGNCSDIEQSAQLSGSHTHKPSLWHDKMTDASRLSRFGMTCNPLTESLGEELLTWWREASHARTFQSQEKAPESQVGDQECGLTWRGSLAKFDPVSRSWKTAQLSLLGDSELLSVIWPRSGMTANGECWELPMLGRLTNETDCGFLQRWPTPMAGEGSGGGKAEYAEMAISGVKRDSGSHRTLKLRDAVKYFPTPTVNDSKNSTLPESQRNRDGLAGTLPRSGVQTGGQLSADWTEWLMGWPTGHTALKPLVMDKSPLVLPQHGECLEVSE